MGSLAKNFEQASGSTPWLAESSVLADGGGFASIETGTTNIDLLLSNANFSLLPSDITISGIEIRIDARKDETNGSGTLQIGTELSWDDGSSWTSSAKKTGNLTTSEATATLGGSSDTWGRTWTRAELQSGTFKLRLRNQGSSILDTPKWIVDYATVAIHYASAATLTLEVTELLTLIDTETISRQLLEWHETLMLADGAPIPNGEWKDFS